MSYHKCTPKIVAEVKRLRATGLSLRKIATKLRTTKAIVEAALKQPSTLPPPATACVPRLEVYRRVCEPAPPPPDLPPDVLAVYEELRSADLVGAIDALVIALDLDLPRCRIGLNVLDADNVLSRLKSAGARFDLDQALTRLHTAFNVQDEERRQIREQLSADAV